MLSRTADVSFIALCILVGALAVHRLWPAPVESQPADSDPALNGVALDSAVSLRDGADLTVLVVVSPQCRFCTESMSLYRRIATWEQSVAPRGALAFMAVGDTSHTRAYLKRHALETETVLPFSPTLRVQATPALFLVDASKTVVQHWIGKLTPAQETELMRQLRDRSRTAVR